jgi:hypothetical protein
MWESHVDEQTEEVRVEDEREKIEEFRVWILSLVGDSTRTWIPIP